MAARWASFFFFIFWVSQPSSLALEGELELGAYAEAWRSAAWLDDAGCKGATTIKWDDVGMMKFRGFPRRTSCRRLSMNRMAHGLKWKPESAARMLISAFACVSRYQLCVVLQSTGLSPGWQMGVKYETKAAGEDGKGVSSSCWNFFSSAFSNLLVDWYSSFWNVSSCCVHVHTCAVEKKKTRRKAWHVLVENDTWTRKQKANEKNNPCRSSQKMLSKQTPNPLKISIQGRCSNRG